MKVRYTIIVFSLKGEKERAPYAHVLCLSQTYLRLQV